VGHHFLMRESAPFGAEVFSALDAAVVQAAKSLLVGRRFIHFMGPLGAGVQAVPVDRLADATGAAVSETGEEEPGASVLTSRCWVGLPMIYKDFILEWRDLEGAGHPETPLDVSPAYAAGVACAIAEDRLIFNGSESAGFQGLLNVDGALNLEGDPLRQAGQAFGGVARAAAMLAGENSLPPYALVVHPTTYASLMAVLPGTARLEIELIRDIATAGVFASPVVPEGRGVLVSVAPHQLDLVVGQDLSVAYLGPQGMDQLLRVIETVALRIRKPSAVCLL